MTVNIITIMNGWIVEVWRDRKSACEKYVYTPEQHDAMMAFVADLTREH